MILDFDNNLTDYVLGINKSTLNKFRLPSSGYIGSDGSKNWFRGYIRNFNISLGINTNN